MPDFASPKTLLKVQLAHVDEDASDKDDDDNDDDAAAERRKTEEKSSQAKSSLPDFDFVFALPMGPILS